MWYAARLIMKCSIKGVTQNDFLFDEQVRLIDATDAENAYNKAVAIGQNEVDEYKNAEGQIITWTFEGLFDIEEVYSLEDGTEITSKQFRASSTQGIVMPKEKLSIFFMEENGDKTAREILE